MSPQVGNIRLGRGGFGAGGGGFFVAGDLVPDEDPAGEAGGPTLEAILATALSRLTLSELVSGGAAGLFEGTGVRLRGDGDVSGV